MTTQPIIKKKTIPSNQTSAFSNNVINSLENLIAPGGRGRLSPYVEEAQILTLFDKLINPKERKQSIKKILKKEEARIDFLASVWTGFCTSGKKFDNQLYQEKDFLDSYLIYYFSMNVSKIQITLLDLIREGLFAQKKISLVDIGVGVGTSAIAFLDLILAWQTVCNLYGVEFPVEEIDLIGLDCNQPVLDYAQKLVENFGNVISQNSRKQHDHSDDLVKKTIRHCSWKVFDVENSTSLPENVSSSILIASNILNELSHTGQSNLSEIINHMPEDAVALLIEPGSKNYSSRLMEWRSELIKDGQFCSTGPCGQDLITYGNKSCLGCWNARRQSFHQPELYLRFRSSAEKFNKDKRSFSEFENRLLSWSSIWLKRGMNNSKNVHSFESQQNIFRYIGSYYGDSVSHPMSDKDQRKKVKLSNEKIKLCPVSHTETAFDFERPNGFEFPALKHGQLIKFSNAKIDLSLPANQKIIVNTKTDVISFNENGHDDGFLQNYSELSKAAVNEIGFRLFGFESMHGFQHNIFERVFVGKSIFGIAATGSGKSECFILPSMVLPGITIVISPLVSLMMDQYDQRISDRYGLDNLATYINGDIPFKERQIRLQRLELGYYKLVYFTPEQLERSYILDSLRRANNKVGIRYLAMDETHCVSQWGHDFRPSYLNLLRRLKQYHINPVRVALTATASPFVRKDVCEELGLDGRLVSEGGDVYVESSNRPELNFIVRVQQNTIDKTDHIVSDLEKLLAENKNNSLPGSAIVFMPTTGGDPSSVVPDKHWTKNRGKLSSGVNLFAAFLERNLNQRISIYHSKMGMGRDRETINHKWSPGNMQNRSRRSEQKTFISGETSIMVATKGFGMGIDKDNVRLIIHRTPPSNLEAYAQEAGRAGRDGNLADVILYYSPDSPEEENGFGKIIQERSDYDIQAYFLSEKYVRLEDILVMNAFLKSINNTINHKSFYFSNDEAIHFFNRCCEEPHLAKLSNPYAWPEFPDRRKNDNESEDHQMILDVGHLYDSKTKYIDRILQALFRVRPDVPTIGSRVVYLDQVQKTGSRIKKLSYGDYKAILNSNAYFGKVFRDAEVSAEELESFCKEGDLIPIAKRIGFSLYETASLLSDIRQSERNSSRTGYSGLLRFEDIVTPRLGPAKQFKTMSEWREYAGASRRATKPEADNRARKAGREKKQKDNGQGSYQITSIEDWFSEKEVNRPTGWEVVPGPAFFSKDQFFEYTQVFISLHNQRKENDWASYHRMLKDYIGVTEMGTLTKADVSQKCLRSVLLGYLETYELVFGDNCFGCSRCVQDENFYKYSIEQRKSVIVKMNPSLIKLFDRLKGQNSQLPSNEDVNLLFQNIKSEEKSGRSLLGYFSGWSATILDQMPNHCTALWLRLIGMVEQLIIFDDQEFLQISKRLIIHLEAGDLLRLLDLVLLIFEEHKMKFDFWFLQADIFNKLSEYTKEAQLVEELFKQLKTEDPVSTSKIYKAVTRLIALHETKKIQFEGKKLECFKLFAGRMAEKINDSKSWYEPIINNWSWDHLIKEITVLQDYKVSMQVQSAACLLWAKEEQNRWKLIDQWISNNMEWFTHWPFSDQEAAASYLSLENIAKATFLVDQIMIDGKETQKIIHLGLIRIANGDKLSQKHIKTIQNSILKISGLVQHIFKDFNQEVVDLFLSNLNMDIQFKSLSSLENWINLQTANSYTEKQAFQWLEKGIQWLPNKNVQPGTIKILERLFNKLVNQDQWTAKVLQMWLPLCYENGKAFRNLFRQPKLSNREEFISELLRKMFTEKKYKVLAYCPYKHLIKEFGLIHAMMIHFYGLL